MSLRIMMGVAAALAIAQTAQAQPMEAPAVSNTQVADAGRAHDCSDPAQQALEACATAQQQPQASDAPPSEPALNGAQADQQHRDSFDRPERRGLARLLLPIDLAREGLSQLRRIF